MNHGTAYCHVRRINKPESQRSVPKGWAEEVGEGCQVCCKPNLLQISYDPEAEEFMITAQLE